MKACYYIDDTLVIAASKAECSANVPKYKYLRLLSKRIKKKGSGRKKAPVKRLRLIL